MDSAAELERLSSRIRAATRDGGLIETAQVKLIGLDEVRDAAGPRWPRMREHVREGSLKIVAAHLGPDDAVIACGDGFLAVYAHASPEEIARRSNAIRDALHRFYLGEESLAPLRPEITQQNLTADGLASMVQHVDESLRGPPQRNELQLGRFWPIWSLRHQSIVAHLCAPASEAPNGKARLAYTFDFVERARHRQHDFLDLDLCLLEQACAAAEESHGGPIGVSVHATTLQRRRSRQIYLEHVVANAGVVKERMFISVAEIEPGVPLISLCEWSNALRRTFARVAFDLHHSDRALSALGSTGIWAAGHHLPANAVGSTLAIRSLLNHLHGRCRTLKQQGILPFFHGFEAPPLLDLAAYSGLSFATGDELWPCVRAPTAIAPAKAISIERAEAAS